jgi:cytochrome c biogenesis protein CcmG/thiol:disulfide interchange protein DsbE
MSNQNNESTGSGRNPLIIIGGGLLLVGAVIVLIFGGTFFGDNDNVSDGAVADNDIVRDGPFAGDAVVNDAAVRERLAQAENTARTNIKLPDSGPPLQVGDLPYEFSLKDPDGDTVLLSQFIGRPLLINFWATWCGPCRIEMPELQSVFEEYGDSEDFLILALDQDESAEKVAAYFDELGLTFRPLLDEDNQTARSFGLQGTLPASIFINPDGEVTVVHRGVMTRGQIGEFLAETIPGKSLVDAS